MVEVFLVAIIIALLAAVFLLFKKLEQAEESHRGLLFEKQSQSVRYGRLTEQWLPFAKDFPFSSESFRFIGNPIDGIVFEEDKIVFCEFKAADSALSEKQKRIREQVQRKQVEWMELKLRE